MAMLRTKSAEYGQRQSIVATPTSGFCTSYMSVVRTVRHQMERVCSKLLTSLTISIQRKTAT